MLDEASQVVIVIPMNMIDSYISFSHGQSLLKAELTSTPSPPNHLLESTLLAVNVSSPTLFPV